MAEEDDSLREWHRLFGLFLADYFTDSPFDVEVESDLSVQQQFLDVIIIRRRKGNNIPPMPDGLEVLADHNLITFKSHHEALDGWAMKELVGHSVAYRKLVSRKLPKLIPEERIRLFAISARFPNKLSKEVPWQTVRDGVYDCDWGTDRVRVVVTSQLATTEPNAIMHLFSPSRELLAFGQATYRQRSEKSSHLLKKVLKNWRNEGLAMPFTMQDFMREYMKEELAELPKEKFADVLADVPIEQRLAGVSKEQLEKYLAELDAKGAKSKSKPKRKKK